MITKDEARLVSRQVYEKLKTVMDPELFVDIVSLGLIYDVKIEEEKIVVIMTLTTPGCPLAPVIDELIRNALSEFSDHKIVVDLVWEPAWNKEMMSQEAKLQLGVI